MPFDLLEFFQIAKNDDTIFAHLKGLYAIKRHTRIRVAVFEENLINLRNHLSELH